jgi:sodium/hydrogen antiporter
MDLVVVAVALLGYALLARPLARAWVSAALFFTVVGLLTGPSALDWFSLDVMGGTGELLASLALASVLFGDATSVRLRALRQDAAVPARLLTIGLLGTVAVGAVAAVTILGAGWEVALLVAVILAPTDAALGAAVVENPAVPARVRQALFVESGLNDGIAVPLFVLALALADIQDIGDTGLLRVVIMKLVVSALLGAAIAVAVFWVVRRLRRRGGDDPVWSSLVPLLTAVACYLVSEQIGGSGFIAAFVGGLAFGAVARRTQARGVEVDEAVSALLQGVTWFLFGALAVGRVLLDGTPSLSWLVYAVVSLTAVRMIPVAVALLGTGFDARTTAFMGWFGPRGLASIVFLLITVEHEPDSATGLLLAGVVTTTVLLSVVLHGLTATPLSARFGAAESRASAAT